MHLNMMRALGRAWDGAPRRVQPDRLFFAAGAGLLAAVLLCSEAERFLGKITPVIGQSLTRALWDSVCAAYIPIAVYTEPDGIAEQALEQSLGWYGYLRREGVPAAEETRSELAYIDVDDEQELTEEQISELMELLAQENEAVRAAERSMQEPEEAQEQDADTAQPAVIPHTKQAVISDELLGDLDAVLETFYTIDSNTAVSGGQIDAQRFLAADLTLGEAEDDGPQILIYHTHSQEAYADSADGDPSTTIVGVGERLAQILTETYGYRVLHHTGEYDVPDRDTAYGSALPAVWQILEDNPSIEVVIDLHRDQMDEDTRLVTDIDGRPTARFMFFNGLSYTKKTGAISYLENENLEGNLAFSFQMQKTAAEYYPGLTRKIYLKGYRYNMHLRARSLLVELGAQNNTVEEAMNACEPLAHVLSLVLQ